MRPVIRDSTLREGLELPGVRVSLKEKLAIARLLEKMKVPEIEIGMPYGMKECIPLAALIKKEKLKIKTSALILSYRAQWRQELEMAADSEIDRFEILFPSSDILLRLKNYYRIEKQDLPRFVQERIAYAKKRLPRAGVGFVDATRTDPGFLKRLAQRAQKAGADRLIVYDTVGIATPEGMAKIVLEMKRSVTIPIIVHCHNDFGLASANSIAGIMAGAQGADVVVNGLGDRGGNASFEQVVLALELLYGVKTGIGLEGIYGLAKYVEKVTGIVQSPVRPIAGEFTFLHSPVQHIYNAASKNYSAFEPFEPERVGAERKYAFTLPVDYSVALEPFYKKLKTVPGRKQRASILASLRKMSKKAGLTEKEVLEVIRKKT